ncbi:MAG: hypothetical protein AAF688_04465, partial [Bacteroidota bacterium]
MKPTKILSLLLVFLSFTYLVLQVSGLEMLDIGVRIVALIILSILYSKNVNRDKLLFFGFLIFYILGDIYYFSNWLVGNRYIFKSDYTNYVLNNLLYIFAYGCLILKISRELDFLKICKKYSLYLLLISSIGVFFVYCLSQITINFVRQSNFSFENFYNVVVIFLMCLSLVNYIYHDDKKSINMLIGSIFIAFSEILQLAYFYVAEILILKIIFSVFFILAFLFF